MKNLVLLFSTWIVLFQYNPQLIFSNMDNHSLYGRHGKLVAKPGHADELSQILLEASVLLKNAQGCEMYLVSKDLKHPNEVWVTEIWHSQEDHQNSLSVPGVRELIGKAMPLLLENPEGGQELIVLGGLGLDEK